MSYLTVAQCMAASAFIAMAVSHLLVWIRVRGEVNHLLFAVALFAAAANAIAEANMYGAGALETMAPALRWYVATSGVWAIAIVWFVVAYAKVGRLGQACAVAITGVFGAALLINAFAPASFLYTELTGLRQVPLPWGEHFWLANGEARPIRLMAELAMVAILFVVASGSYQFWTNNQRTRAWLFGLAAIGFMGCFGTHAYFVDTGRLDSPYLSSFGFLALVVWMSYELAGEVMAKTNLVTELEHKEDELRSAVATERNRIAGDLHDSVTQMLFSTAAIADALPEVWDRYPDQARRALDDLKLLTKASLAEMRTLLLELRPTALLERPLGDLLRQLANAASGRTRTPVRVEVVGEERLPNDVHVTLYRVAQESLHNAIKHARATKVDIRLVNSEDTVALAVRDDGCGFENNNASPGMGLQIMRERVRAIDGRLKIESTPVAGTRVEVQWKAPIGQGGQRDG